VQLIYLSASQGTHLQLTKHVQIFRSCQWLAAKNFFAAVSLKSRDNKNPLSKLRGIRKLAENPFG
jgi:hypothetical protein